MADEDRTGFVVDLKRRGVGGGGVISGTGGQLSTEPMAVLVAAKNSADEQEEGAV